LPPLLISEDRPLREILSIFSIVISSIFAYFLFMFGYRMLLSLPLLSLFGSYAFVAAYNFAVLSVDKQRLFDLSITDELTELFNIRYFKMSLKKACEDAMMDKSKHFCVILCDVDDFKYFNDSYGHQTGDIILKEISKKIKSSVRSLDVVARYGGEEIIIFLNSVSLNNGLRVAETIRKNAENVQLNSNGIICNVTISLGWLEN